MRIIWAALGFVCVILGVVGIVLPLVPTVPFLLLATFFFARSSSRMHHWLVTHRLFGPIIDDWNRTGAIRPDAKRAATVSLFAVILLSALLRLPAYLIAMQVAALALVALFIWTRPNG